MMDLYGPIILRLDFAYGLLDISERQKTGFEPISLAKLRNFSIYHISLVSIFVGNKPPSRLVRGLKVIFNWIEFGLQGESSNSFSKDILVMFILVSLNFLAFCLLAGVV